MNIVARIELYFLGHWPGDVVEELWKEGYPWIPESVQNNVDKERSNYCRPCHYFDYIAGTSTGG
jgi:hypothetical protein